MNKKVYVLPMTEKFAMAFGTLLAQSHPETEVDGGKGPTGITDKDSDGSDESDAKNFNAWSSWDE